MTQSQNFGFLNYDKYRELETKTQEVYRGIEEYRQFKKQEEERSAYKIYCNSPCESKEDLVKIAAMAYAWMPTMLTLYFEESNWIDVDTKIKRFKQNDQTIRKELVQELSRFINHSIVGTSKVLHFINPEFAPIIDSRVTNGWNRFFKDEIAKKEIFKLPSSWNFNDKNHSHKVELYIKYWDRLMEWKNNINSTFDKRDKQMSIRDIEFLLYCIGGKIAGNEE